MLNIRNAEHKDASAIKSVHVNAIKNCCTDYYSAEQINIWTGGDASGFVRLIDKSPFMLVAEINDEIVGFCTLRQDFTLMHLYVCPVSQKQGVGGALLNAAIHWLKEKGQKNLELESSLNAVAFYKSNGLKAVKESYVTMKDQKIAIVKMIMGLNSEGN